MNEALFRAANERLVSWAERHEERDLERYYCECADSECRTQIELSAEQYEQVRTNARWFVLAPGHVTEDIEDVIRSEARFEVVEKHANVAGLVERLDERNGAQ